MPYNEKLTKAFNAMSNASNKQEGEGEIDWNALVDTIRAYNKKCDESRDPWWQRKNGINWIMGAVGGVAVAAKVAGINKNTFHRAMAGLDKTVADELKQAMGTATIDDIPRNLRSGFALENEGLAKAMRDQMIAKGLDENLVSEPQRLDVYLNGEIKSIDEQIAELETKSGTSPENMKQALEGRRAALISQRAALDSVPETKRPYIISVVDGEKVKAAVDCGAITQPAGVSNMGDLAKHSKKLALEEKVLESYSKSKKPIKLSMIKKAETEAYRKYALRFNKKVGGAIKNVPSNVRAFGGVIIKEHKVGLIIGTVVGGVLVWNNWDNLSQAFDFIAGDETSETSVVQISAEKLTKIIEQLKVQKGVVNPLSEEEYKKFRGNVADKIDVDSEEYGEVAEKINEACKEGRITFVSDKGLIDALQSVSTEVGTTEQNPLLKQGRSRNA